MKKLLVILGFVSFSVSAQKMTIDVKQVQSYFKYNIADTGSMYEDALRTFSKTGPWDPMDPVGKENIRNVDCKYVIDFDADSSYFYSKKILKAVRPILVENSADGVLIIRILEGDFDYGLMISDKHVILFDNYSNNTAEYMQFLEYKISK